MASNPLPTSELYDAIIDMAREAAERNAADPDQTRLEACHGTAFSILAGLDGVGDLPQIDLVVGGGEQYVKECQEADIDYYVPGEVITDRFLHDSYYSGVILDLPNDETEGDEPRDDDDE